MQGVQQGGLPPVLPSLNRVTVTCSVSPPHSFGSHFGGALVDTSVHSCDHTRTVQYIVNVVMQYCCNNYWLPLGGGVCTYVLFMHVWPTIYAIYCIIVVYLLVWL